ncbi:C1orf194 [Bugula neritina]|uniref:C1orf194 n=1 Tax=Bugula neritina TaxID=10212 RepID=A0A7J7KB50_BUGNE|nr:C1orf194 [Bugula neritina]
MSQVQASGRNPYPYPLYENDDTYQGGVFQRKEPYGLGEHLLGEKDPWVRLNRTPTLSSARREVYHFDPQAPNDSLDFCIKTTYDQHNEFLKCPAEVRVQKETHGNPEGRVLKNRIVEIPVPPPELGHPLKKCEQKQKKSLHQAKGNISGHYSETTNNGFSRKPNGSFFST